MPFDPDAYLAAPAQTKGGFDPDAYLAGSASTEGKTPPDLKEVPPDNPLTALAGKGIGRVNEALTTGPKADHLSKALSELLMLPGVSKTLERIGNDGFKALFSGAGGLGGTSKPKPETMDAALAALPAIGPALKGVKAGGTMAADAAKAIGKVLPEVHTPSLPNLRRDAIMGELIGKQGAAPNSIRQMGEQEEQFARRAAEEKAAGIVGPARSEAGRAEDTSRQYSSSEAQVKLRAKDKASALLEENLGKVVPDHDMGTPLKGAYEKARDAAYKARKEAADYGAAKALAIEKEAAGRGFAASPEGKATIAELQAMKKPRAGLELLSSEQEALIDKLIEQIKGRTASTKVTPFGEVDVKARGAGAFEKIQNAIRELRKVDEKPGSEITGYAALGKERAHELIRALTGVDEAGAATPGKGLYGWNPEYAKADSVYRAHSQAMERRFGTEKAATAGRGESFDFKTMAASPSEFPSTFFKDAHSVRQLNAATGDPALTAQAAKQWAAKQMRGMDGEAARKWATDNASWITEAKIQDAVGKQVGDMLKHDVTTKGALGLVQNRVKYLTAEGQKAHAVADKAIKGLEAAHGDIAKASAAKEKIAKNLEEVFKWAKPGNLEQYFDKSLRPEMEATGMFSREALDSMAKDLATADKQGNRTKWFKKAASTAAYGIGGSSAGHAVGLL